MKLCDVCVCVTNFGHDFSASLMQVPEVSERGCGSSKRFMTIIVLEIQAFIPRRIISQLGLFFFYARKNCVTCVTINVTYVTSSENP